MSVPRGGVVDLVRAQVASQPGDAAVVGSGTRLSYRQLWALAGDVAATLARYGAGPGDRIGIHAQRSPDLAVAVLGTLLAGAACVPLDVSYPAARLSYFADDSGVRLLLGHEDAMARLDGARVLRPASADPGSALLLAERAAEPAPGPADLCYVLYTSGSTGRPKGVAMHDDGVEHLVRWQRGWPGHGRGVRTVQLAPLSFDVAFQELLCTLGAGGTLVCCTEEERSDPVLLWELLRTQRVERVFLPYVTLQMLALVADETDLAGCRLTTVVAGGEPLQCTADLRALFRSVPRARLVNQYGATEVLIATQHELASDPDSWPAVAPIGRPIAETCAHLLDAAGHPVPPGGTGELVVAGPSVGHGYWGLPELTAARFVADPCGRSRRAYRTGDLVAADPEGMLRYVGRGDGEHKVRGVRVDLAEVEAALAAAPGIAAAVATTAGADAVDRYLAALVVTRDGSMSREAVLASLSERLPAALIPSRLVEVDVLPRTPSGKADRSAVVRYLGG